MSGNTHYVAIWADSGLRACNSAFYELQQKHDDYLYAEWAVSEGGEVYISSDCNNEPPEGVTVQAIEKELIEFASGDSTKGKEIAQRWINGEMMTWDDIYALSQCVQREEAFLWSVKGQETFKTRLSLFRSTPYKFGATNMLDWYERDDGEELWVVKFYVHS